MIKKILAAAFLVAATATTFAEEAKPQPDLTPMKHAVAALDECAAKGIITDAQAKQGTDLYLARAKEVSGREVTLTELAKFAVSAAPQPEAKLTALQKFAGLITFVNVMWCFAIVVGVACFAYLARDLIVSLMTVFVLLASLPLIVYEVICYLASSGVILYATRLGPETAPYVALTGCLLFAAALGLTFRERGFPKIEAASFLLAIAWGATAVKFDSQLIGFFAVIALMSGLGFSAASTPLCYAIGFRDRDAIGRATSASFMILAAYVAAHVYGQSNPIAKIFEPGALFMGTFVGYIGVLISSSRFYCEASDNSYALRQVFAVALGVAALYFGSVWQISELQKIGGTFFALYIIEKFTDIPAGSTRGYALIGLVLSGAVYWFSLVFKQNPDFWRTYLVF